MLDFLTCLARRCAGLGRCIIACAPATAVATVAAITVTRAALAGLAAFLALVDAALRCAFRVAGSFGCCYAAGVAAAVFGAWATVVAASTATA